MQNVHVQRLHGQCLVFADQSRRELVLEVLSLIGNFLVTPGDLEPGFVPVLRPFLLAVEPTLEHGEPRLGVPEIPVSYTHLITPVNQTGTPY